MAPEAIMTKVTKTNSFTWAFMPRFGSQALVISRRNHLDLEKLGKATPRLLSGLDQVQADDFVLLFHPV
jgi:hypothetical protein